MAIHANAHRTSFYQSITRLLAQPKVVLAKNSVFFIRPGDRLVSEGGLLAPYRAILRWGDTERIFL
jgi:hypothetical protein